MPGRGGARRWTKETAERDKTRREMKPIKLTKTRQHLTISRLPSFSISPDLCCHIFSTWSQRSSLSLSLSVSLGGPKKREKFRKCLGLPQRLSLLPIPLLSRLLLSPRAARPLIHFFWRSAHPFSLNIWRLLVTSSGWLAYHSLAPTKKDAGGARLWRFILEWHLFGFFYVSLSRLCPPWSWKNSLMNTKVFELPFPSSLTRPTEIDIETIFWRMTSSLVFNRSLCRYDNFRSLLILSPIFKKMKRFMTTRKKKCVVACRVWGFKLIITTRRRQEGKCFVWVCVCVCFYIQHAAAKGFYVDQNLRRVKLSLDWILSPTLSK